MKGEIIEVASSITNNGSWGTQATKDLFSDKFDHDISIICLTFYCLHPFGNIINRNMINCKQNVEITKRTWKQTHKIYAQTSIISISKTGFKGIMFWRLVFQAFHNTYNFTKRMTIFKNCEPIKVTLQNLCSSFLCTKVASTSMVMAEWDNIVMHMIRNTPSDDLIGTILE